MKLLVISILTIIHVSLQTYTYNEKYFTVALDHFSFSTNYTFPLRYLINDSYWSCDGPIFLYTGNEGRIDHFAQNTGFMWEIAAEFQALLVFAEHRYYGKSLPFGNLSFSAPKYVGYLTSSQALADYVDLIDYIQNSNTCRKDIAQNPVIAFGGSYGGILSAWLRIKYPASVTGAIAASAPLWQFGYLVPCDIFNRIVTSVYKVATSYDCSQIIIKSWKFLREVTATEEGKQWLTSSWKLCDPIETDDDTGMLMDWLQDVYSNMAMVNYPYPTDFITDLPAYPVKAFCDKLRFGYNDPPHELLLQLGKALSVYTNSTGTSQCLDIFKTNNIGEVGWDFQACTELVMPMCSKNSDMFINADWNFTQYAANCSEKWKTKTNSVKQTLLEYGGKHLHTASNIVFSNGLLDPWSGGGVLKNISKTVVAFVMPDAAHHLDLRTSHPNDPHSVIAARKFHKTVIEKWLRSYYMDHLNQYYYYSRKDL